MYFPSFGLPCFFICFNHISSSWMHHRLLIIIKILSGGSITNYFGGYESDEALYVCLVFCIISCFVGSPIPFIDTFWLVSVLIWFLLFCGGALVPPLTGNLLFQTTLGIMISSVPLRLRAFANSNATTLYNLFGFLPAPTVYGLMTKYLKIYLIIRINDRAGVTLLMFSPWHRSFGLG